MTQQKDRPAFEVRVASKTFRIWADGTTEGFEQLGDPTIVNRIPLLEARAAQDVRQAASRYGESYEQIADWLADELLELINAAPRTPTKADVRDLILLHLRMSDKDAMPHPSCREQEAFRILGEETCGRCQQIFRVDSFDAACPVCGPVVHWKVA